MPKNICLFLNLILFLWSNINCEILNSKRIEELKKIIDDNSGQKALFTYSEYKEIEKGYNLHSNDFVIKFYKGKVDILIGKIEHFVHYKLSKPIAEEKLMEKIDDEEEIKIWANKKINIEVINCKLFMIELYTDNAEGTFLDLDSFIENGKEKSFQWLKSIFNYSKEKNEEIDELINLAMISVHIQNKEKNKLELNRMDERKKKQIEKVLIEGGGPNGLYAAIEFFMSGMSITLVNDRILYTRIRSIYLYNRWIVRINFLCSTKNSDKLPWYKTDMDYLDLSFLNVYLKELEKMMKDRLESLIEFNKKWKLFPSSSLMLLYETEVKKIEYSEKLGNFAYLGLPIKSMNYRNLLRTKMEEFIQENFPNGTSLISSKLIEEKSKKEVEKWIHKEKMANIQRLFEKKYGREIKEDEKIFNKRISPNKLAELEMTENGGEWMKLREYPKIQFDLLFCAGGINDRIRTEILGVKITKKVSTKFASAIFIRGNFTHEFIDRIDFSDRELEENLLKKQKIEEFLKLSQVIPNEFKEKYKNLNDILRKSLKNDIMIHQNEEVFQFTMKISPSFAEFFEEIDKIKEKDLENAEKIQKFRNCILRKWFAAIFDSIKKMEKNADENFLQFNNLEKIYDNESAELNIDENGNAGKFDINKINFHGLDLSVFGVSILTAKNPVKLFLNGKGMQPENKSANNIKHSAIIAAIGDANANMHFFTGEAVSIGRLCIENVATLVKKYNHGKIKNDNDLVKDILQELRRWQKNSVEKMAIYENF